MLKKSGAGALALGIAVFAPGAVSAMAPAGATTAAEGSVGDAPRFCSTRMLSPAELEAGVRSVITCYDDFAQSLNAVGIKGVSPTARPDTVSTNDGSGLVAVHYDGYNGTGSSLSVGGSTCEGGGISFGAGDWWNDRISSTRHQSCSQIKHWTDADYQGATQLTNAGSGGLANLNATLNDAVSSIKYYGPVN